MQQLSILQNKLHSYENAAGSHPSSLFAEVEEELSSIFSNYPLLGEAGIEEALLDIRASCETIYSQEIYKTRNLYEQVVDSQRVKETYRAHEKLRGTIENLRAVYLPLRAINEGKYAEDSCRQGLVQLYRQDRLLAKRVVGAQHDPNLSLIWKKAKDQIAHEDLEKNRGKGANFVPVYKAVLLADLSTKESRDRIASHIQNILEEEQFGEIVPILTILEYVDSIPKNEEELQEGKNAGEVMAFCLAFRTLHEKHPFFARKLIKRLNDNPVLDLLAESTNTLDLQGRAIHVQFLEAFVSLVPSYREVRYGEVVGDSTRLDLSHCSPRIAFQLLKDFSDILEEVTLSPAIISSPGMMSLMPVDQKVEERRKQWELLNEWGATSEKKQPEYILSKVKKLVITEPEGVVTLPMKNLVALVLVFPHCHYAEVPDLQVPDLVQQGPGMIFDEIHRTYYLARNQLHKSDKRFQNAILRAMIKGTEIHPFTLDSLASSRSQALLAQVHLGRKMFLMTNVKEMDWERVASMLLGAGIFSKFIFAERLVDQVNLSNNPLLTDQELLGFLEMQDKNKTENGIKIKQISLRGCLQLSDSGVVNLFEKAPNLEYVDLRNNPHITDEAIRGIPPKNLTKLRVLDLRGTTVSYPVIDKLRKEYPKLSIPWNEQAITAEVLYQERDKTGNMEVISGGTKRKIHREMLDVRGINLLAASKNGTFTLPFHLPEKALDTWIHYLYTGHLSLQEDETAFLLMQFSQEENLANPFLTSACRKWLSRTMTPANVFSRYEKAKRMGLEGVADAACEFIDYHLHPYYPSLDNSSPEVARRILSDHEYTSPQRGEGVVIREEASLPSDLVIKISGKGFAEDIEITCNRSILSYRSSRLKHILDKDPGNVVTMESRHPEELALIIRSLLDGERVDISSLNLEQLANLLEEADRYGVADTIISVREVNEWMKTMSRSFDSDLSWLRLLKWAKDRNETSIGGYIVREYLSFFDKKGHVKEPYASDPLMKKRLELFLHNPNFAYFHKLFYKISTSDQIDLLTKGVNL